MKLINKTECTIMLDDINLTLIYDRKGIGVEVDDALVEKSLTLQSYIENGKIEVKSGDTDSPVYRMAKMKEEKSQKEEVIEKPSTIHSRPQPSPSKKKAKSIKKVGRNDDSVIDGDEDDDDGFFADSNPTYATGKKNNYNNKSDSSAKVKFADSGIMDVKYSGYCYNASGYAKMNRGFCLGLGEKDDVNLQIEKSTTSIDIEHDLYKRLNIYTENEASSDSVKIYGTTAQIYRGGGYNVQYTMMETEKVHPQYIERCNQAKEVWLPTRWCMDKFKESGLIVPAVYMPIGVDFDIYNENQKPLDFNGKVNGFTFLSVFGWSLRKGYDVLLRAYLEEFSSKDDVSLLICSRYAGMTANSKKEKVRQTIRAFKNSIKKPDKPNIVYFGDVVPENMMGSLYGSAHAYVGISRGEGQGLPWLEASMCGLPVIASNYSGLTDFLTYDNSYLVEPDSIREQKEIEWISAFYEGMPMADYGDNAVQQTRAHMREVYENYAKAKEKNNSLQKYIKTNYNWSDCVGRAHNRIKDIYSNMKK